MLFCIIWKGENVSLIIVQMVKKINDEDNDININIIIQIIIMIIILIIISANYTAK